MTAVQAELMLPALNALLNAVSAVLATRGLLAIRRGDRESHRRHMLAAAAASAAFLASYLIKTIAYGTTRFGGSGALRTLYLVLLGTHLSLAIVVTPLVLAALILGLRGRYASHRKVARVTWPLWLYVSVSGVLVFLLLRPYYGQP